MDNTEELIVVEGLVPTRRDETNLRDEVWSFALDQRAFGPRKLWVAFANREGRFRGLAYADRTDPPELGLAACIRHLGRGADAAVAFCDEPVAAEAPPADLEERFDRARATARTGRVHLVDWIACDDHTFRSFRLAMDPDGEWWDV